MAHMLEMVDGKAQMAYVGETPWHGLGVKLEEGVNPQEMMQAAGLDWKVKKVDMYYGNFSDKKVEGKQALIRESDEQLLDIVGVDWNPVQNIEAFNFFDSFCKAGQMSMHTAGSLFDGKRVWALAKIASDFELFNGDKVEGFLLFSNPHKFGQAVDIRFTPVRVVCNNTLTLSLGQAVQNAVKLNHRKEFEPEGVKQVLGLASKHMDEYKETAKFLGSKQVSDEQLGCLCDLCARCPFGSSVCAKMHGYLHIILKPTMQSRLFGIPGCHHIRKQTAYFDKCPGAVGTLCQF